MDIINISRWSCMYFIQQVRYIRKLLFGEHLQSILTMPPIDSKRKLDELWKWQFSGKPGGITYQHLSWHQLHWLLNPLLIQSKPTSNFIQNHIFNCRKTAHENLYIACSRVPSLMPFCHIKYKNTDISFEMLTSKSLNHVVNSIQWTLF